MAKQKSFSIELETEIIYSITRGYKGKGPSMEHAGGEPDEPPEVEDVYVGVIVKGTAIDITALLNKRQMESIVEECFENAESGEDDGF